MKQEYNEKKRKAGSPIFILIIFIALLGFVFYVPEVYKKYNSNFAEFLGIGVNKDEDEKNNNHEDEKDAMSSYYQIGSLSSLEYNEIKLTDISLSDDKILSFTVETDGTLNFEELNYYLEFYQNRSLFIGRRALTGEMINSKKFEIDVSNLDVTTTTYFVVSHIEDSVIGPIDMPTDESGLGSLTCVKNDHSYLYDFNLGKLIKVTEKYSYTNLDINKYSDELFIYEKKAKEYNEYIGITAIIADNSTTFIYSCEYDYTNVSKFSKIPNRYIFEGGTENNVIKFKMEAEGYECE